MDLNARQRMLVAALQDGLPLVPHPYRAVAARAGLHESEVVEAIGELLRAGIIKRLGVVVRHRELGYTANAMVVWDVPDARVDAVGRWLGGQPGVTLCYRRPRRPPRWPYNLFCMIHGRCREQVLERVRELHEDSPLSGVDHAVLFSTRRFKQRGARYRFEDRPEASAVA